MKRIFGTAKFRFLVFFVLLFLLAAGLSLSYSYDIIRRSLYRALDRELEKDADPILYEYVTGRRFRAFDRYIDPAKLSAAERQAFQKRFPGIRLLFAFGIRFGKENYHTVYGYYKGNFLELRLQKNGQVYSRRINTLFHLKTLGELFQLRSETEQKAFFLRRQGIDGQAASKNAAFLSSLSAPGFRTLTASPPGEPPLRFRAYTIRLPDGAFYTSAVPTAEVERQLAEYRKLHLKAFYTVLAAGILISILLLRRAFAGVARVSAAARRMRNGDFSYRVPCRRGEGFEVEELVSTFNRMNENTEHLFSELRMVTDNVAHDLRTPLTRMRGLAEVTVNGPQTVEAYRELAATVAEECFQLVQIINTMLEITRTEAKIELFHFEEFDLAAMLRRAGELYEVSAEMAGVKLCCDVPAEEIRISGDPVKLQRVVSNLLDNAIKFSAKDNSVKLSLAASPQQVVLSVQDHGCGIDPADQKRIFERFYRTDASRSMKPGNGLGLALVQAIVTAHHGSIEVESTPNVGTTFRVTLPRRQVEKDQPKKGK